VKSGLEEVDQFIQEYQLNSPNVTKIYGNDDFTKHSGKNVSFRLSSLCAFSCLGSTLAA
jgi:hypothetical protein